MKQVSLPVNRTEKKVRAREVTKTASYLSRTPKALQVRKRRKKTGQITSKETNWKTGLKLTRR